MHTIRELLALASSRIREIQIVGRRGPMQAKFASQTLGEFGAIAECSAVAHPNDLNLSDACRIGAADKLNLNLTKNLEIFQRFASSIANAYGRCYFHFFRDRKRVLGHRRVEGVRFARTKLVGEPFGQAAVDTEQVIDMLCSLAFRSVG